MEKHLEVTKSKRIISFFAEEIGKLEEKIMEDNLVISDYISKINKTKED